MRAKVVEHEDRVLALEAEVEDLKLELQAQEESATKGDAFAAAISRAQQA